MADDPPPPPPPNQAQEDATTLLREVEERRQSMGGEPPEIAAMRRLLAQFTPTEPEIDESELLPRDLGDLDDTNEFADAFWARATKEKMAWSKWPGSLWAACAKHERSVLSLKVLDQRVTVEFTEESSRVLLAREIAMPAPSSDKRRVAPFHEGYRALQWASSPYCLQLNGGDLREYFGKLTALKDCCATLKGESLIDDEALIAKWATNNVGRAQLTVQPPGRPRLRRLPTENDSNQLPAARHRRLLRSCQTKDDDSMSIAVEGRQGRGRSVHGRAPRGALAAGLAESRLPGGVLGV